jgi:competence protein ComGC
MEFEVITAILVFSVLIFLFIVVLILLNEKNKFKKQMEDEIKRVVSQINNSQSYSYNFDIQEQTKLESLEHDIKNAITLEEQNTTLLLNKQQNQQRYLDSLNDHMNQWRSDMGQQMANLIK